MAFGTNRLVFGPPAIDLCLEHRHFLFFVSNTTSESPFIQVAVDNVSFSVFPGQVLGLLGPNGAGKTTTIDVITAQTGATKGKV